MRASFFPVLVMVLGVCATAGAQDAEIFRSRIQSLTAERQRIDSMIAVDKAWILDLRAQKDSLQRVSGSGSQQRQGKAREAAARIAEISRKIADQRTRNRTTASRGEQMTRDSLSIAAKAAGVADSLARAVNAIAQRRQAEDAVLAGLTKEKTAAETAVAAREAEQRSAVGQSHAAVARFDAPAASQKIKLQESQNAQAQARNDSTGLRAKIEKESARMRAEIASVEKKQAALLRQADSLAGLQQKQRQDSIRARATADDSVRTAATRLDQLRRTIDEKDTAVAAASKSFSDLRRDSLEALSAFLKESRERKESVQYLDSLIPALQNGKSTVQLVLEKLHLDSMIDALTPQGGARLPEAEAQKLDACKGKSEILLRSSDVNAMIAELGNPQWRKDGTRVAALVGTMQVRLDSASSARDQLVSRGVIVQNEQQKKMAEIASRLAKLKSLSTTSSRELVNAQARLGQVVQDSVAAAKRRDDKDGSNRKKQTALAAALAAKKDEAAGAAKQRDDLTGKLSAQETVWQKSLDSAHTSIQAAFAAMQREKARLDSIGARQEKARIDSVAVDKEKGLQVAQAKQALQQKLEAVKMRNGQIALIDAQIAKARSDSLSVIGGVLGQMKTLSQTRIEQERLLREGENALSKLEQELGSARADSAAAVEGQLSQSDVIKQQIAAVDQQITATDQEDYRLKQQRAAVENDRIAVELELRRIDAAAKASPPPQRKVEAPPEPVAREAAPPPAAKRTAAPPPAPALSRKQMQAQEQLTRIYELIEQEKIKEARKSFSSNRDLLERNLDPDAYAAIAATIDALVETVEEAPAFPAPQKKGPPEKKPAPEKKPPKPSQEAVAAPPPPPPAPPPSPPQPQVEPGKPATVFISSLPPVANVYMDGQMIGKTNVGFLNVSSGKHTMQFVKGEITCTREMVFIEGKNPTTVVKLPCP